MFHLIHPDYQLAEIRERHARLHRHAQHAHHFRASRGRHRYRSRSRQP